MQAVDVILIGVLVYAAAGVLTGTGFVVWGVGSVDPSARGAGAPWAFRLVIWPGAATLWPWIVVKWARGVRAEGGRRS